ncbi:hypothetical protein F5X98DRAFT_339735 [Xylaria grammica]|nr:hypothetical protein F5X98DRAFT_339735 [Xylaria grammica]
MPLPVGTHFSLLLSASTSIHASMTKSYTYGERFVVKPMAWEIHVFSNVFVVSLASNITLRCIGKCCRETYILFFYNETRYPHDY